MDHDDDDDDDDGGQPIKYTMDDTMERRDHDGNRNELSVTAAACHGRRE